MPWERVAANREPSGGKGEPGEGRRRIPSGGGPVKPYKNVGLSTSVDRVCRATCVPGRARTGDGTRLIHGGIRHLPPVPGRGVSASFYFQGDLRACFLIL